MKYTRLNVTGYDTNVNGFTYAKCILCIVIVSLLAGSILSRFIILPFVFRSSNKSIKMKNCEFYFLQAGIFTSSDNANKLKEITGQILDVKPYIINDSEEYRVVIALGMDKEYLNSLKNKLKENGFDSLINSVAFNFTSNSSDKELLEYLNKTALILRSQLILRDNFQRGKELDLSELIVEMNTLSQCFSELNSKLDESINNFNNEFSALNNDYINSLKGLNIEQANIILTRELILTSKLLKTANP